MDIGSYQSEGVTCGRTNSSSSSSSSTIVVVVVVVMIVMLIIAIIKANINYNQHDND